MSKKKVYKRKTKKKEVNEPLTVFGNRIHIFKSFAEQDEYQLKQMALLSSKEILLQLRKFINIAYGMHGFDPNKLPSKHSIKIIK